MAAGNDIAVQSPARDRLGEAPACLWGRGIEDGVGCEPVTKDYLESQGSPSSVGGLRGLSPKRLTRKAAPEQRELSTELVLNGAWAAGASRELEAGPEAGPGGVRIKGGKKSGEGERARSCCARRVAAPQPINPAPAHSAAKERPKE